MRSERWMTPGTYSRPAEPMPFTRPNLAPLALTHSGPFGPSTTWGMRSLKAAEAFLVKRSGGSQIRSTWPSAEMTSYFMSAFLREGSSSYGTRHASPSLCLAIHPRPVLRRRDQQDERGGQRQDQAGRRDGIGADREAEMQVVHLQRHHQRAARGIHPEVGKGAELPVAQKVDEGHDGGQHGHDQARDQEPLGDPREFRHAVAHEDARLGVDQVGGAGGKEEADSERTEQGMKGAAG